MDIKQIAKNLSSILFLFIIRVWCQMLTFLFKICQLIYPQIYRILEKWEKQKILFISKICAFVNFWCVPNAIVLSKVQGHRMYLDLRDIYISRSLCLNGIYEKGTTSLFKELVKEGMVVVDVGAHIGYYTLIAASKVGNNGKVFAFEPAPSNYALLVKNIEVNRYTNIFPIQKAVSNTTGKAQLFLCSENPGGHKLYGQDNTLDSIEVETVTLDDFIYSQETSVDIIKIDVEGWEYAVFQGMNKIVEQYTPKIIFEFSPLYLQNAGFSALKLLEELRKYNYKYYVIDEENLCKVMSISQLLKVSPRKNVIALPMERLT